MLFRSYNNSHQQQEEPGKINVTFKTLHGHKTDITFEYGTTVGKVLELYLQKKGGSELNNDQLEKLLFLFNGQRLTFTNNEKIENFFKYKINPVILVA